MSAVGLLIVLVFVAGAFWLAATDPWRAILAAVVLAPWGGLYINVGLWLNAYQIMVLALLVMTFLRSLYSDWRPPHVPASGFLIALWLWAILASLVQIGVIPDLAIKASDGPLRGPGVRAVIQMFMFTFTISPALLVAWHIRRSEQIVQIARTYLLSVAALAGFGWLQLLIWYGTGTNPMPIGFVNIALGGSDADVREGIVGLGKLAVYRMNSFANEPRALGGALAFAMLILQAVAVTWSPVRWGRLLALWFYLAITMLATLSTSAIFLWLLGTAVQFPLARLFGARLRVSGGQIAVGVMAVVLPFMLAFAAIEASGFPLLDLISARTIERIDASGAVEDFDLAIFAFLDDHPERLAAGVGLGNAHLYATRYLDPEFQWYALGRVFVAKYQYLRFVSEIGIIGFGLFLSWVLVLLIETARAVRRPEFSRMATILPVATMALTLFMISGGFAPEFVLLTGAMGGLAALNWQRGARAARPVTPPATPVAVA
ncbi:MAG: hypothetical protein ACRCUI_09440 [Polymorphobacter sp.]